MSYALESWTGKKARGQSAMEAARYTIPRASGTDLLVIGISASGATARTIEAINLARQLGAQTLAISCNTSGALSQKSHSTLHIEMPEMTEGPGLLSYIGALLAGYALAAELAEPKVRDLVDHSIVELIEKLPEWLEQEASKGQEVAQQVQRDEQVLFMGSGPVRGSAMFSAAKAIEAAGQHAIAQDVEEWAHLEYFCEPAASPVWMLSAGGRSSTREEEVAQAARQIGRNLIQSEWDVGPEAVREELSPLALWAGPVAYADSLMRILGEEPFRGFGGGRHPEEGGGISRIRSSAQIGNLKELERFNPPN